VGLSTRKARKGGGWGGGVGGVLLLKMRRVAQRGRKEGPLVEAREKKTEHPPLKDIEREEPPRRGQTKEVINPAQDVYELGTKPMSSGGGGGGAAATTRDREERKTLVVSRGLTERK